MREAANPSDLLAWYDRHARSLPWRVSPADRKAGAIPEPYHVWLSEIMLQQTTVAAVKSYFERFTRRWPSVIALANAEDAEIMAEWAGLGYYARARNLLKCARVIRDDLAGAFPRTRDELIQLPGVGPYTAAAISAIAFDAPSTVVDGNVERVMARLHRIETPLPKAKPELTAFADTLTPLERPGDYAQAVMDLGATICTPRNPACGICPWQAPCKARAAGITNELPRKEPKKPKPVRYGIAYVVRRLDGAWLLETRPDKGLLGGMLGWPGSDWSDQPLEAPPINAEWIEMPSEVRHTFTHFHLRLRVLFAEVALASEPKHGEFVAKLAPSSLPTVMRKVYDVVKNQLDAPPTQKASGAQ
ncbi:A/G-specific adenine glycosylase [Qingshengfaniella alkalisoli]|uniref:Adenine DNA glycosylase n=1 Tax=Qingshengfaniella alkalisoli TaxID=2599296 RepID=A0A5B8IS11_9RHOB|nr:A/G-specific adenine glycosylase [Qingshengfaniella alkalisoli]QDY68374.1 A/G-specific adenine glycosylase [Qingshengfaniella alkalisoli]